MILLMYPPPPDHLERLQRAAPDHEIRHAGSEEEARLLVRDAEIVMGNRYFIQSLPYAGKLRWFQSNSVGVDLILSQKEFLKQQGIRLTCARGVYDTELAEHTLAMILALYRSLPLLRDEQNRKNWKRHRLKTFRGSRCLILGWGSLSRHIASVLAAMGGKVSAVRNQLSDSVFGDVQVFGQSSWRQQLPHTDLLIICLPKTPETCHFVGAQELSRLPSSAFVVNIGRGGTLDDQALCQRVSAGQLAGAALDVFEEEPLPHDSKLWTEPRILVSPHAGRSLEGPGYKWFDLFEENLRRYLAGEELLNLVDYDKGY